VSEESARKTSWGAVVLVLVLVVALYVLSFGPAAVIANRAKATRPVLEVVYAPLIWLYENTPLREPLRLYMDFWLEITGTSIVPP